VSMTKPMKSPARISISTCDYKNEPYQNFLARNLTPGISFSFEEAELSGKRVVVLQIPAAKKLPTAFVNYPPPKGNGLVTIQ